MKTLLKLLLIPVSFLIFSFISIDNSDLNSTDANLGFWSYNHEVGTFATYEQLTFNNDKTFSLDVTSTNNENLNYFRIMGSYSLENGSYNFKVDSYRINNETITTLKGFNADYTIKNQKLTIHFPDYLGGAVTFDKM